MLLAAFFWLEKRIEHHTGHTKKGQSRKQGLTDGRSHLIFEKVRTTCL